MVERKIKILGMDTPSPDKPPFSVHKLLLKSKIFILENLTNMEELLEAKKFEVIALPLKIKADSSISRVVARII
jgi:kynurenine formamidase